MALVFSQQQANKLLALLLQAWSFQAREPMSRPGGDSKPLIAAGANHHQRDGTGQGMTTTLLQASRTMLVLGCLLACPVSQAGHRAGDRREQTSEAEQTDSTDPLALLHRKGGQTFDV